MNKTKIVVDSSVAIKWYIPQPYSSQARQILDDYQTEKLTSLLAPDLIYAEVGNIIWKYQRFQGLATNDALEILNQFKSLGFLVFPISHLLEDAYSVAINHQRTVYDSLYLALSLREQCRFVTADQKLVNAVGSSFPNAIWIGEWS